MRDDLLTRILTLAETLVETRYWHRCRDDCHVIYIAVDQKTADELEAALKELREMEDV